MSVKLKNVMQLLREMMSVVSFIIAIILIILIAPIFTLSYIVLATFVRMHHWFYNETNDNNPQ